MPVLENFTYADTPEAKSVAKPIAPASTRKNNPTSMAETTQPHHAGIFDQASQDVDERNDRGCPSNSSDCVSPRVCVRTDCNQYGCEYDIPKEGGVRPNGDSIGIPRARNVFRVADELPRLALDAA